MNRTDLLTAIEAGRAELNELWSGVGENALTQRPGPQVDWSVKDLMAHLAYWEQTIADCIRQAMHGESPNWDVDVDAENARLLALTEGRSLAQVRQDFQTSLEAVRLLLDDLTEEDFSSPERFDWLHGNPAWMTLADNSFQHYAEHLPDLRRWRESLDANS